MLRFFSLIICVALVAGCSSLASPSKSSSGISLEASKRLPVSTVIEGFSLSQSKQFQENATVTELLRGEDTSLWWNGHISNVLRTAIVPRRGPTRNLTIATNSSIGLIEAETLFGKMSLNDFLMHPDSFAQGFIVIHNGQIVFEEYPGMKPNDLHLWASNAKPIVSLMVDLLIADGRMDESKPYKSYMPDFVNTAVGDVDIRDILDMASGLDLVEDDDTRADPKSIIIRLFRSEFDLPDPVTGKWEGFRSILKETTKLTEPGEYFGYGSTLTQALVLLVEEVTQKPFMELVDEEVWSKMGTDGGLYVALAPDGMPAAHGVVSSNLRDMARFGMLYTPSSNKVSSATIVRGEHITRIQKGVRSRAFFEGGNLGPRLVEVFGEDIISNSYQWDVVFKDGDFFKGGLMSQGIYVSPDRDLVIGYFSTTRDHTSAARFLRPIATSGLFD